MLVVDLCKVQDTYKMICNLAISTFYHKYLGSASAELNCFAFISLDRKFESNHLVIFVTSSRSSFWRIDNRSIICEHCYFAFRASTAEIIYAQKEQKRCQHRVLTNTILNSFLSRLLVVFVDILITIHMPQKYAVV